MIPYGRAVGAILIAGCALYALVSGYYLAAAVTAVGLLFIVWPVKRDPA
jgi:hypothetical protein